MGKQSQRFHKWYLAMTTLRPRRQLATHFMVRYEEHDFHIAPGEYPVEFIDVFHMYNDLALVISLHRSWILYMRKIDKYRGVVGFLDPEMVLQRRIAQEADEVGAYIVKALLAQQDKECIFVVCQEGYHWVLLVIFPKWNTVYIIDSKGYQPPSSYSINKLFDRAFCAYVKQKGRHDMKLVTQLYGKIIRHTFNHLVVCFVDNMSCTTCYHLQIFLV
ncbi:hypothetical protein BS78_09G092000 [Paspalum vaginatum]|nr:hypothetical protein BS78_09G092000 [Paspalum vaginatum]